MTPTWALFVFINLWWVSMLAVISSGNSHQRNAENYDYAAAPDAPNLKRKFWWATLISGCATALIALLMGAGIISFV